MKQANIALAGAAALLLAGCEATPKDRAAAHFEVKAAIATQLEGYAKRDLDKIVSVMAPDYVWINHGQPDVRGEANVRAAIAAQLSDPALALTVADEQVDLAKEADMAVYRAIYRYTYTDPSTKRPTTELGNWVAIFRRQPDGTMKLARDVIVDLPAVPAT